MRGRWKALLPRWPAVPARLWLAIVLEGMAILNVVFQQEIWSDSLRVYRLGPVAALLGAAAVGTELIWLLWHWPVGYHGPRWARLLFRGAIVGVVSGLMIIVVVLAFAALVVFSYAKG